MAKDTKPKACPPGQWRRLGAKDETGSKKVRTMMTDDERKIELAIRKEAGLKIDTETAEVERIYARKLDPYGVYPDLPDECDQVGREYFARSPGSDLWVNFGDLPDATRDALWRRHKSRLAFPAGLIPFELFPEEIDEFFAEDE